MARWGKGRTSMGKPMGNRSLWMAAGVLAAVTWHPVLAEDGGEARELVRRVIEALPKEPLVAQLSLSTSDGGMRKLELRHKFVNGARSSYLEVIAPEELQGIRFLFLEHSGAPPEQYIKVAASRTPVQVADQIRKQPFLSSAFYVSDLVEPELDAYTYRFVGDDEVIGRPCKLVESVPKNGDDALYSKTIACLDPKDLLVLRREFFDPKHQLLKVWTVEKAEKVDGHWTILKQRMVNAQEQRQSTLQVTEIKYGAELNDQIFSPKYLGR